MRNAHSTRHLVIIHHSRSHQRLTTLVTSKVRGVIRPNMHLNQLPNLTARHSKASKTNTNRFRPNVRSHRHATPPRQANRMRHPLIAMFNRRTRRVIRHAPLISASSQRTITLTQIGRTRPFTRTRFTIHKNSRRTELHRLHMTNHFRRSVNKHRRSRHISILLIRHTTRVLRLHPHTRHLVRRRRQRRRTILTHRRLSHKGHQGETMRLRTTYSRTSHTKAIQYRHSHQITKAVVRHLSNVLRFNTNNIKSVKEVISSPKRHLVASSNRLHSFRRK